MGDQHVRFVAAKGQRHEVSRRLGALRRAGVLSRATSLFRVGDGSDAVLELISSEDQSVWPSGSSFDPQRKTSRQPWVTSSRRTPAPRHDRRPEGVMPSCGVRLLHELGLGAFPVRAKPIGGLAPAAPARQGQAASLNLQAVSRRSRHRSTSGWPQGASKVSARTRSPRWPEAAR